jgi:hypothetical protein
MQASCLSAPRVWLRGADISTLVPRLTTTLPGMTHTEALDTTRFHRVAGRTGDRTACVTVYPASV